MKALRGHDLYVYPELPLKFLLETNQVQQCGSERRIDKNVDIAALKVCPMKDRTKYAWIAHRVATYRIADKCPVLLKNL